MATAPAPHTRRFTKSEYHRMHDLGWFIDQYVELIDREVISMPGPGHPHCISTDKTMEICRAAFGKAVWVRVQMPLDLGQSSEPIPDVAVVSGARDTHLATPTTALLLVEVSDSTLAYDRGEKASLFAAAGIADYWIVNLQDRCLEVHRNPVVDPSEPFGHGFADVRRYSPNQTVSPLALPSTSIRVSDLLP